LLAGPADWARFLIESVPEEFVVKPARGYHGLDVRVVRREGLVLAHAGGERLSAAGLCAAILADRRFRAHVVQERLRDHPGMPGGGEALQTVRMVTLAERGGGVALLNAQLKVARPGSAVDNFQDGATGSLIAPVRPGDGVITAPIGADADGVMREVTPAPADGLPAPGTRLPLWGDAVALVRRAAPVFLPMRCGGWDVAITPGGPVIVEGDMWWDPPSPEPTAGDIARRLRHAQGPGRAPSRRDRRSGPGRPPGAGAHRLDRSAHRYLCCKGVSPPARAGSDSPPMTCPDPSPPPRRPLPGAGAERRR